MKSSLDSISSTFRDTTYKKKRHLRVGFTVTECEKLTFFGIFGLFSSISKAHILAYFGSFSNVFRVFSFKIRQKILIWLVIFTVFKHILKSLTFFGIFGEFFKRFLAKTQKTHIFWDIWTICDSHFWRFWSYFG